MKDSIIKRGNLDGSNPLTRDVDVKHSPSEDSLSKNGSAQSSQEQIQTQVPGKFLRNEGNIVLEDIAKKTGNYIVTYGQQGAGKSTLQSFLLRWIERGGQFTSEVAKIDKADLATRRINQWRSEWDINKFPETNPEGEGNFIEMRVGVKPRKGVRDSLTFSFFEMSGEDLGNVVPKDGTAKMASSLRALLKNPKIKIILVLMADPRNSALDTLFMNLLDYMHANFDASLFVRLSILIVISKPEKALEMLKENRNCHAAHEGLQYIEELNPELVNLYLETFCPASYNRVKDWPTRWGAARFYMGIITIDKNGEPTHYSNVNYEDIDTIFRWIYRTFVGKELGKTRWDRFLEFLKN